MFYCVKNFFSWWVDYSNETYNYAEFPLLESKMSIYTACAVSVLEFILCTLLMLTVISGMMKLFEKERRKVALPMLRILCIPSVLTLFCSSLIKIFKTVEGHLATNPVVNEYVRNKVHIASQKEYLEFLKNPYIARFEKVSSISYVLSFVCVILVLICILYTLRIRRFTEGDYKKK